MFGQCCNGEDGGSAQKVEDLKSETTLQLDSLPSVTANVEPATEPAPAPPEIEAPPPRVAPAPEPVPSPPIAGDEIVMTFELDGAAHDITVRKGPLGLSYAPNKHPIVIAALKPGGYAEGVGIKQGMVLAKVDGVDMKSCDFATADKAIKDAGRKCAMTFEQAEINGGKITKKEIVFRQGPLGMSYAPNCHPLVIVGFAPNSYAEQAGVVKGMKLEKVDGADMCICDFATADEAVKAASKRLAA